MTTPPGPPGLARRIFLAVLLVAAAVVLYLLPFHVPSLWPLGWFALWPLVELARRRTPRSAAALGYLTGFLIFAIGLAWVGHVSVFGQLGMAAILACFAALFFWLVSPATDQVAHGKLPPRQIQFHALGKRESLTTMGTRK